MDKLTVPDSNHLKLSFPGAVFMSFHGFNVSWTRGFKLLTRGFKLVTRGLKLLTRGFELALLNFNLSFKLSTRN